MSRRILAALLAAAAFGALALPAAASAAPAPADSIWVVGPSGAKTTSLHYGDSFTAGYTTRTSQAWGYAECRPTGSTVLGTPTQGTYSYGDAIWSEYRSIYAGGPIPSPFQLTDPIQQLWLGGGATCTLSLIKYSSGYKNRTVLATSSFEVTG